jgi:hypothetical protein
MTVPRAPLESMQLQRFAHNEAVSSVRADCWQVIDGKAIVLDDSLRPVNGRLDVERILFSA